MIGVLFIVLLAALAFGIGAFFLRRLPTISVLERLVFAVPLGLGLVAYTILGLGLLGQAKLVPLTAGVLVLGLPLTVLGYRSLPRQEKVGEQSAGTLGIAVALVLGLCGLITLVGALNPPGEFEWDSLSYHLAAPKRYLQEGRIYYIPDDHHSNFPFTLQMLYLWMLSLGSVSGAKLCHWLCGVLLTVAVYTCGARHFSKVVGQVAALIVATTPILLWESTTAYIDLALALFSFLSFYAALNALTSEALTSEALTSEALTSEALTSEALTSEALIPQPLLPTSLVPRASRGEGEPEGMPTPLPLSQKGSEGRRDVGRGVAEERGRGEGHPTDYHTPWLLVSAVLMGLALGTKSTALVFWGMGALGLLVCRIPLKKVLVWAGVALLVGLPWYLKTFLYTGDPVYPFGWKLFHGRYWNEAAALGYAKDQAAFGLGKDPLHLLLAPWNVTMEPGLIPPGSNKGIFTEYWIFGLSPVYLGLGMALPLLVRRWDRAAVACLLWGLGISATWFFMMQQTRYLAPALPAFALACAWGLAQAGKLAQRAGGALVSVAALWGIYVALMHLLAPMPLKALEAAETWINTNAPKDAKVVLFDETRGLWLDRPYIWGQPNHAPGLFPYDSYTNVDAFVADFKRRGYTYLLQNTFFTNLVIKDEDPVWARWRTLLAQAVEQGKIEVAQSFGQNGPIVIYRIP